MFFLKLDSCCPSFLFSNDWRGQLIFKILAAKQFLLLRYNFLSFLDQFVILTFDFGLLMINFAFIFKS